MQQGALCRAPCHENRPAQAKAPFPPWPYHIILKKVAPEIKGYPRDSSSWIAGITRDSGPSFALTSFRWCCNRCCLVLVCIVCDQRNFADTPSIHIWRRLADRRGEINRPPLRRASNGRGRNPVPFFLESSGTLLDFGACVPYLHNDRTFCRDGRMCVFARGLPGFGAGTDRRAAAGLLETWFYPVSED